MLCAGSVSENRNGDRHGSVNGTEYVLRKSPLQKITLRTISTYRQESLQLSNVYMPVRAGEAFASAERGRKTVLRILESIPADASALWLILPEKDKELNQLCCGSILDEYLEKKSHDIALIIYSSHIGIPERDSAGRRPVIYRALSENGMQDLLNYYRLIQFSKDIIVASYKEPYSYSKWIGHFGIDLCYWVKHILFFGVKINWMAWEIDHSQVERAVSENYEGLQNRKVIIYGLTQHVPAILRCLRSLGIQVSGLIDSNPQKAGYYIKYDLTCHTPEALFPRDPEKVVLIVSKYASEMRGVLYRYGYTSDQIVEIPADSGITAEKDTSAETLDREFQLACRGMELRSRISDKHMIVVQYGTGDVYYACAMIRDYLKKSGIRDYILIIPDSSSCSKIPALFGISAWHACSMKEIALLYKAWEFFGSDYTNIRPFLNLGSRLPRILGNTEDSPDWNHWLNALRYQYFAQYGPLDFSVPDYIDEDILSPKYEAMGYPRKRTVLLSPYANAFSSVLTEKTDFWEKLAERLKQEGLIPVTNAAAKENAIAGTKALLIPYEELPGFLNYAGCFIAIRSGLCDLAGSAGRCRFVHIYERGSAIRPQSWSLRKMGIHENTVDIVYQEDVQELLDSVMQAVLKDE